MGATLDETQLELEAQRARVRGTADRLETTVRRGLNVRAIIGRNPMRTVGPPPAPRSSYSAGHTAPSDSCVAHSGPPPKGTRRTRPCRRRSAPSSTPTHPDSGRERQRPRAKWRSRFMPGARIRRTARRPTAWSPRPSPPGPSRAFWALVEVAGVTAAGIIAKQVVARSLAGGAVRALLGPARAGPPSQYAATTEAAVTPRLRPIPRHPAPRPRPRPARRVTPGGPVADRRPGALRREPVPPLDEGR